MTTVWVLALAWAAVGLISAAILIGIWIGDRWRGTSWIEDDPEEAADLADYNRTMRLRSHKFRVIDGGL